MKRKEFKSRLFKKKIKADDKDYWFFLFAEVQYRLKQLDDLKCPCGHCFSEKLSLEQILIKLEKDQHIPSNPKANKFTGKGDCGRRLGPVA
ncbi:hypothetical protein ACFLSH_02845 [Bacteroidota bacterium]